MIPKEDIERGRRLEAFCEAMDGKPVTYGIDDCSTWPAQWAVNETGCDLDWPEYSSREEAQALIDEAGGLAPLWDAAIGSRFEECHEEYPPVGSIGIIRTRLFGEVGVIFVFAGVVCWRHETGVRVFGVRPNTIVKAWLL